MWRWSADLLVVMLVAGSALAQLPQLASEFRSPTNAAQWVVPWSELLYCTAGVAATYGFIRRSPWATWAAGFWSIGVTLAACFAAGAYGGVGWGVVAATFTIVVALGALVVWCTHRRVASRPIT